MGKKAVDRLIKKLKDIYRNGYVAARDLSEPYSLAKNYDGNILSQPIKKINCFAHACLNLTNTQINKLTREECEYFFSFTSIDADQKETIENASNFLSKIGLEIEKCAPEKIPKSNQWMVAYYFQDDACFTEGDMPDFHFILKEKNNLWSSKMGKTEVNFFEFIPQPLDSPLPEYFGTSSIYHFQSTYMITNLNATKESEETRTKNKTSSRFRLNIFEK